VTFTARLNLVTGGAGFIGSHLVDYLIGQGEFVRVLDNFSVGRRDNLARHRESRNLEVVEADISDTAAVIAAGKGVERAFHLAARADIVPSIQDPTAYFRANVDGTFAVLEAARRYEFKRLVYVASSSCYGIPEIYPTPETAPADPRYPYALTKYLGELSPAGGFGPIFQRLWSARADERHLWRGVRRVHGANAGRAAIDDCRRRRADARLHFRQRRRQCVDLPCRKRQNG
jgi:hypothetical protein